MTAEKAAALCEELDRIALDDPGPNVFGEQRVRAILQSIAGVEGGGLYLGEKVHAVRESFAVWHSARRWNVNKDGGERSRMLLRSRIAKVAGACRTALRVGALGQRPK